MAQLMRTPRAAAARRTLALLTAVLLLAAAARLLHITQQALWIDEGATYTILKQPDRLYALATRDHHPPLYYLLLDGWLKLAGDSVLALRLFSALCSVLSVAAVVPLARAAARGRPAFQDASVPILAALMLALSDPEVVLAQDARMYALRTLLVILSALFYLRWTRRPSPRRALPWIAASVALLHTQYQGIFILAAEGLHALVFLRGGQRLRAVGILALIGGLFAPWFALVGFNQRLNDPGMNASLPSNWQTLADLRHKFLSAQWPLLGGLLLWGTAVWRPSERPRWRPFGATFLLLAWILLTVVISFIGNLWYPILAPHRLLLITPALAILIAQGLRNVPGGARGFLVAVIVVYGVTTVDDYYPKEPWDKVGQSAALYARPGDLALMEVYRGDLPLGYYLDHLLPPSAVSRSLRMWRDYDRATYPGGVLELLAQHPTVWLIHWSPDNSAFDFLAQTGHVRTATLTTDHWGNTISTYRYDLPPAGQLAAFTSGMTLRRADVLDGGARVDLWWSADAPLPVDYTVSAFLLDAGGALVAQHDSYPLENRRPTTQWTPGEIVYDPHPIPVEGLPPGRYTAAVQVYTWFDGQRYPLVTGEPWAIIGTLER